MWLTLFILAFAVPVYFPICINGAEMFVADPGQGAIYVGASDDRGSFSGARFRALPLQNLMLPWAVAFDNRSRTVFWTDGALDAILRANIDGTEQRVIVDGLGYPAGLAIDTVNDKLYWTDYELHEVGSSTLKGTERKVLVKTGLQRPRGITVSTRYSLLFWADERANTIERVHTNGSNRMAIVSSGLEYPTAVSLNYEEDRLYWVDFGRGRVESVEIDGGDRRAHVEMVKGFTFIKPYGLALLGKKNKIFYSDNTQSVILEIDQSQGSEREPITIEGATDQFQDLRHIFISEFSEVICDPGSELAAPQQAPCPSTTTISSATPPTVAATEPVNSTTEGTASRSLPTPMLIIVIAGSSIIGILAIILMIGLGINISRDRAPSVDKGTTESRHHNQYFRRANDIPSPSSDPEDAPNEYEVPDGFVVRDYVNVDRDKGRSVVDDGEYDVGLPVRVPHQPEDIPNEYEVPDGFGVRDYINVDRDKGRSVVANGEYDVGLPVRAPHQVQQIMSNTFDPKYAPIEYEEPDGLDVSDYMNVDRDKGRSVVDDGYVEMHGLEIQHTYSN